MNQPYAPGTAGFLANKEVPTCRPDDSVELVLSFMRELAPTYQSINYIYVHEESVLVGVLSIHELFCADPHKHVREIMTTPVASVHVWTDQEHVAQLALAQSIKAVPVVGDNNEFVGVISSDKILQILNEEHTDDFYKSAGLELTGNDVYHKLPWLKRIQSRMPWLLLGLVGGISTAYIIKIFESTIATQLIIASFIPAVVCLSDAVGNQSEMIYIRTFGKKRTSLWSYLGGELGVASVIGSLLAFIMFTVSYVWIGNATVSIILALSIIVTVYCSVFIAVFLPWMFERLGFDPAVTSGPLATVIYDISSIIIYLSIASLII